MFYILIGFPNTSTQGYQEIFNGNVQRITDLDGTTLENIGESFVVDANPTQPSWALPDPVQEVIKQPTILTRLQFRNLFTTAEKVAIYTAAQTNMSIRVWLDDLTDTDQVDLSFPQTIQSVETLEAGGLIAPGRAAQILAS